MDYINNKKRQGLIKVAGFTLVEVIIACSIISVSILALMSTAQKGIELSTRSLHQVQANTLLEEGAEAVKSIRDNNWVDIANLNLNENYYLVFDTNINKWTLIFPPPMMPGWFDSMYQIDSFFNRTVEISPVYRNSNDDISATGTLDNGTKKVTVTVSWESHGSTTSEYLVFYIANIFN